MGDWRLGLGMGQPRNTRKTRNLVEGESLAGLTNLQEVGLFLHSEERVIYEI